MATVHLMPTGITTGTFNDEVGGVAVVPGTNQVVLAGDVIPSGSYQAAVVVLTAGGQLDTTFNGTGYRLDNPVVGSSARYKAVAVQPQRLGGYAIVVTGDANNSGIAARYTLSGSLDTTFGGAGTGYFSLPNTGTIAGTGGLTGYSTTSSGPGSYSAISVAKDGSLVIAGSQYYWNASTPADRYTALAVGHLSADGVLDTSFGTSAGFTYSTAIYQLNGSGGLALAPNDGGIVVCGTYATGTGTGVGGRVLRFTAP